MKPLEGIFVVDLSRVLAGPFASMRLADLGARVVKVEPPEGDPTRAFGPPFLGDESTYFLSLNRGKESLVLDLAKDASRQVLLRLIEKADILLENFRPGGLAKLGFARDLLERTKPDLVHCRISGYGSGHPRAADPAFDLAVQAETGMMAMTGEPDAGPSRAGISVADLAAGSAAVEAILAALLARARRPRYAEIEVSLYESLLALFGYQAQSTLAFGRSPERMGSRHPSLVPYQAFAAVDGFIVLAIATDRQWRSFLTIAGLPGDLDRPEWATNAGRVRDRDALEAALAAVFRGRTVEAWDQALREKDVPLGIVRTVGEALAALRARGADFLGTWRHDALGELPMMGSPIRIDGVRAQSALAPPVLGADTDALLWEFAADAAEAARWRAAFAEGRVRS